MADPEAGRDPGSLMPTSPPSQASPSSPSSPSSASSPAPLAPDDGRAERPDPGDQDEAARLLRGGPGEPHAGARPGQPDQAAQQGFGRQRGEPHDGPSADARDKGNIAGEKDFELQPPST